MIYNVRGFIISCAFSMGIINMDDNNEPEATSKPDHPVTPN
jgi:hypothetical protein